MTDKRCLELLAEKYPNRKAAIGRIISLRAVLALPKGTEYFLSDIHGEYDSFVHMIKSASGIIKTKIDDVFGSVRSKEERADLAALVYDAESEVERRRESELNYDKWCYNAIYDLIEICKAVSTKYTRNNVVKMLPEYWRDSIDELMHATDEENKTHYYNEIIVSIVESGMADDYIIALADSASKLAVDRLHILGDIWDRGTRPDKVMDYLMKFENVDIQWGNHDVLWMGAAAGNRACITNVIRINSRYYNFDMLEVGYGINMRALSSFAQEVYRDDPCDYFRPKILDEAKYDAIPPDQAARMHKAIAICQFKVEGQMIKAHPEYGLDDRLLLDKIDYQKGTVKINGRVRKLKDTNFPTIDPEDPYKLTEGEERLMKTLQASFLHNEKLQRHMRFLFSHGSLYKILNNNLLYHGCMPVSEDGSFLECNFNGTRPRKTREYLDYLDEQIRRSYFEPEMADGNGEAGDLMWYLWLGDQSPLFGKDRMATFESLFLEDKELSKEVMSPYYALAEERIFCESILKEFGLDPKHSRILNGHVPVKIKDGESPIKGEGKLIMIDGGISKAYQKTTGIAGYTFIATSRFTALAEHKPYSPKKEDGTQEFRESTIRTVQVFNKRYTIKDTDQGGDLEKEINELRELVKAFRQGDVKEIF